MKKIILFFSALIITCSLTTSAMAIGIGVYIDGGVGNSSWGGNAENTGLDLIPTGGLILDTAAAKNAIFNYRLKAGGGKMFSGSAKLNKVGIVNTFGLSPSNMRGDQARFFFGPRIGLYYVGGRVSSEMKFNPIAFAFGPYGPLLFMQEEKIRVDLFRIDIGMVLFGFNFNLGDAATITFEFGGNFGVMLGENSSTITIPGYEFFGTMGFMYRINDSYTEAQSSGERGMQVKDLK